MTLDRRALLGIAAGAAVLPALASAHTARSEPDEVIELWPNGAPGMPAKPPVEVVTERHSDPVLPDRSMTGITRPRLHVFRPEKPNGAAVMITPGGGYKYVVLDREGHEIARWLTARGFTAFVLLYRLPGEGWAAGPNVALADAQRAMRLIRHRAAKYSLDPARVAAMGFSAGGHVCADLLTRFAAKVYDSFDAADALSARPFVAAPIYPVVSMTLPTAHAGSRESLIGKDAGPALQAAHAPDRNVPADAPPVFLVHAENDGAVPVENSLLLRAALRARKVPVETHLFSDGEHGFAIRRAAGKPAAAWTDLFLAWAKSQGLH